MYIIFKVENITEHGRRVMNERIKEDFLRGSSAYPFVLYQIPFADQTLITSIHWQDDVEILSVTNGEIELTLDGEITMLKTGDIVCINPGQIHGYRGITEDTQCDIFIFPWEHLEFVKEDHNQNRFLKALIEGSYGFPLYFATDTIIREIIIKIIQLQKQRTATYEMMTKALLLQIIALLAEKNAFVSLQPAKQDGICKDILRYIHQHYMDKLTVSQLSTAVGISPTYFCAFFAEHFHQHFTEYLRSYRIEQACFMLTRTTLSITEIAFATGFSSSSHFIHCFCEMRGITPLAYRKKNKAL